MITDSIFCADVCVQAAEPLAGTVSESPRAILVTWPKANWAPNALDARGFPAVVKDWFEEEAPLLGWPAFYLIDQGSASTETVDVFLYPENIVFRSIPTEELAPLLMAFYSDEPVASSPSLCHEVQILLCTHGRRDACCAKYGQQVYGTLRQQIQEQSLPYSLWQSSHLGGHRFAATGIIFPQGDMYGRLAPEDVPVLLNSIENNHILPFHYRGTLGDSLLEQAALGGAYLYAQSQGFSWQGRCLVRRVEKVSEESHRVWIEWGDSLPLLRIILDLVRQGFGNSSSCGETSPAMERKRWVVQEVVDGW